MQVDGLGDGAMIECPGEDVEFLRTTAFGLLQGCRMRNIKTEYVSCPSCGRTLFNLQVRWGGGHQGGRGPGYGAAGPRSVSGAGFWGRRVH